MVLPTIPVELQPMKELTYMEVLELIKTSENLGLGLLPNPDFKNRNDILIGLVFSGFKWTDLLGIKAIYSDCSDNIARLNLNSFSIFLDYDFQTADREIQIELLRVFCCSNSATKIIHGDLTYPIETVVNLLLNAVGYENFSSNYKERLLTAFKPKFNPFIKR